MDNRKQGVGFFFFFLLNAELALLALPAAMSNSIAHGKAATRKDSSAGVSGTGETKVAEEVDLDGEDAPEALASEESDAADHSTGFQPRPGWSTPKPKVIPHPTYWPIVMALGITFFAWGALTTFIISILGLILFGIALAGWIGDIRHEDGSH